tara:strand:+ start:1891 stop:2079 length:189 start_codon:yes stop_codon:yes gene_type:complete
MTNDELFEIVAVLTAKNMALEEKIEKMKESHEFRLRALQQQIDLYKRLYENKYESEVEEEDH